MVGKSLGIVIKQGNKQIINKWENGWIANNHGNHG